MWTKLLFEWFRSWSINRRFRRARTAPRLDAFVMPLEHRVLLTTYPVTTTSDSGAGSLRQQIINANNNSGLDTITFQIPGTGVQTISLLSPLPSITDSVIIDGTKQTGYVNSPLIQIDGTHAGNTDGLDVYAGNTTIEGIDITNFADVGLVLSTGGNDVIKQNYIGVDPTGSTAEGNTDGGLDIYSSADNQVTQNVISGNGPSGFAGVYVANSGANDNVFTGNLIGTDATGTIKVGNGGAGILLAGGAQNNQIGTNGDGVNDSAERNIISGNGYQGVDILGTSSGANTTGNYVAGNYIGTNATGTAAIPNGSDGVLINGGATNNRIGVNASDVDATAEMNLISGNAVGVGISDAGTSSNVVAGNLIGTDITGTNVVANSNGGLDITNGASSNRVGFDGTSSAAIAALERNVISGNGTNPGYAGVFISDPGTNSNVLDGNYVGVDISGSKAMGNSGVGVYLANGAQDNLIGTDGNGVGDALEGNVISANAYQGIAIQGTSSGSDTNGNVVAGNFIGTNATATGVLPNQNNGIWILDGAQSNRIGSSASDTDPVAEGNVIGGNVYNGIEISNAGTNSNIVSGNWIGTNTTGSLALPNMDNGIQIDSGAQNTQVGGSTSVANTIEFNTLAGVSVIDTSTTGNSIRANVIFGNGGLGIDLGDTDVQVNHAGAVSGPNNLQNYPLIQTGTPGSTTVVTGTLNSLPSTTYTLDFYANSTPNITFYGPGQRDLGSASVTTDPNGNASFSVTLSAATSTGDWITATATDPNGNTSEFAGDRQIPKGPSGLIKTTWTPIGPGPVAQSPAFSGPVMSGRVESAAPDPTNPNIMYLAADGGGVWKTSNWLSPSPIWTPLTDAQPSTMTGSGDLAYKSLVVFQANPSIIFAAAGGPGGGILKSTDHGASWTLLGSSVFNDVSFGSLVVDPTNANNLFVTVWYGPNSNSGGVYKSTDGGVTWTNTTAAIHPGAASDISMDPNNPSILYAGLVQDPNSGATNGLYKSTDGGNTWTLLTGGMLTGSAVGVSVRVVVAPSSSQTLYATVFDPSLGNAPDGMPHRFRSDDGGATWTSLASLPTGDESRYWHILLTVDPTNPQTVYVNGDHTVYVSTNGGSSWTLVTNFEDPVFATFDDNGNLVETGDHGIFSGTAFANKQGNLQTSEFYTFTLDPTNANIVYGIAQDQFAAMKYDGYPVWNSTGQAPDNQDPAGAGETGKILVNPSSPNQLFRYAPTDTDSFILKSTDGGATWSDSGTGIPTTLAGYGLAYASQKAFQMDPSNSQRILVGTNEVYETTDGGATWHSISPILSTSSNVSDQYITALAIAPSQPNTVYAATGDGRVFKTTNDGTSWTEIDSGLPIDFFDQIGSIQVNPTNPNEVFITPQRFPTNVFGSAHVWMTTTGGSSGWTDISGNLSSDNWTNGIAVDWRSAIPVLYIATARGVYQSADMGQTWSEFGESLPNSVVSDIQINTSLNILACSTYGRGVFEIQLGAINRVWTGDGSTPNWSNPNNWSGDTVPNAGDNLIFGPNAKQFTVKNDLATNMQFGNIVIESGGYSISGNPIQLSGTLDGSLSTGKTAFGLAIVLEGPKTVLAAGPAGSNLSLNGTINTNGKLLEIAGGVGQVSITAGIAGSGSLTVNDPGGSAILTGPADSYTGSTIVSAGTLILNKSGISIPGSVTVNGGRLRMFNSNQIAPTATVTISSSSLWDLNGYSNTIAGLTLIGGVVSSGAGTLTLNGNVTDTFTSFISGNLILGAATVTMTENSSSTLSISANISGSGNLYKAGAGILGLSGTNPYSGSTTDSAGRLQITGTQTASPITVDSGATLMVSGTVGTVSALSGGIVTGGDAWTVPGTFATSNLNLASGSQFYVDANSTTAGTGYSQVVASGPVTLTGSMLKLAFGFTPLVGTSFTILNKESAGAVVGTFKNLAQNGTIVASGMTFQITYTGGDGNDVVIKRIS